VKSPPKQVSEFLEKHDAVAMATLVGVRGTSSARVGSRMWIGPDGSAIGAVTIGGCVDVRAIELSGEVLASGESRLVELALGDDEAQALGMTCGGIVELLVERVDRDSTAARALIDQMATTHTVVIVGASEIAVALVRIAKALDLRVVVVDGREHLASAERFPDADEIRLGMPSEIIADIGLTPLTALVLISHEYKYDLPVLRAALGSGVGYVGMLGGKKRRESIKEMLRADGVPEAALERLRTPIGLDIGAETPAEIAVSIAAQLVAEWKRT
jgi:xanthine dehydrogenase accessory factor